jgi:hypothetical protein
MSPGELLAALASADARFAEPVAMLLPVLRDPAVKLTGTERLIPSAELAWIYVGRRDRCQQRGHHVPGLAAWVEVLAERPEAGWRLVSITGAGHSDPGAVFIAAGDSTVACMAFSDPRPVAAR